MIDKGFKWRWLVYNLQKAATAFIFGRLCLYNYEQYTAPVAAKRSCVAVDIIITCVEFDCRANFAPWHVELNRPMSSMNHPPDELEIRVVSRDVC